MDTILIIGNINVKRLIINMRVASKYKKKYFLQKTSRLIEKAISDENLSLSELSRQYFIRWNSKRKNLCNGFYNC